MAGSINLANVALGFDASKIQRGVDLTAGEMRKLNQIFQGSISNVDKYNAEMQILDKSRKTGALTAERLVQAEESLAKKYGLLTESIKATTAAKKVQLEVDRQQSQVVVAGGMGGMTSTLARYAGVAATFQGVKSSLSLAATAESNKIALEVMTGSVTQAEELYRGFQKLDRESPLSRSDFSRAAQTLIGYGKAAETTLPALKQLSEISAGNADKFQSLTLAFGQVTAAGRLMGQEVLQMVNAGFNPLQEISRTTGRSMVELKKAMEDGAISVGMVEDALRSATSEGGRFYDMNERLKNSAGGQWAKMKSDVELLSTEIGTNLLPTAKMFMDLFSSGGAGGNRSAAGDAAGFVGSALDALTTTVGEGLLAIKGMALNEQGNGGWLWQEMNQREQERKDRNLKASLEAAYALNARDQEILDKRTAEKALEKQQKEREAAQALVDEKKHMEELAEEEFENARLAFVEYEKRMEEEAKKEAIEKEFKRREDHINKELQKRLGKGEDKYDGQVTSNTAQTLRAGSVEAYKFLLAQRDNLAEKQARQAELAEEANKIARDQLQELRELPRFAARGGK